MKPTLDARYSASWSLFKFAISLPSTIIFPFVGVSKPPSRLSSVDFPAPLGPRITTNFPCSIFKLTSSKAFNS